MSQPRFFRSLLSPGPVELDPAEATHAAGARRLRPGDAVILFDGRGGQALATLKEVGSRRVIADVADIQTLPRCSACELTLAFASPKQARQDDLVEKCTELGVAALQPIRTQRGVAAVRENRLERWQRITVAAAKQSGQAWLPDIREECSLQDLLSGERQYALKLLADPAPDALPLTTILDKTLPAPQALVLIGPEGGFTEEEHRAAVSAGAIPFRLTPTILRIETAAMAAAAVMLSHPKAL